MNKIIEHFFIFCAFVACIAAAVLAVADGGATITRDGLPITPWWVFLILATGYFLLLKAVAKKERGEKIPSETREEKIERIFLKKRRCVYVKK